MDDFLAQSTVPAGQQQRLENAKKEEEKLKELTEKYFTLNERTSIQINQDALNKCRVISNILAGVSAGIQGFGAAAGVGWWLFVSILTSVLLWVRIQSLGFEANGESKFFKNTF